MEIIEFDRWKLSADNPNKLEYAGQRPAQEVFEELKYRLESQGYLATVRREGPYYAVVAGREDSLDDARALQNRLRQDGYDTLVVNME